MQFLIKTIVSAIIISTVAIVSKKFTTFGAIIASLPLTSILAMIWIYQDTKNTQKIIDLSMSIFWIVLPSLTFFIAMPMLLKRQVNFYLSLILASVIMLASYSIYVVVLRHFGINI